MYNNCGIDLKLARFRSNAGTERGTKGKLNVHGASLVFKLFSHVFTTRLGIRTTLMRQGRQEITRTMVKVRIERVLAEKLDCQMFQLSGVDSWSLIQEMSMELVVCVFCRCEVLKPDLCFATISEWWIMPKWINITCKCTVLNSFLDHRTLEGHCSMCATVGIDGHGFRPIFNGFCCTNSVYFSNKLPQALCCPLTKFWSHDPYPLSQSSLH